MQTSVFLIAKLFVTEYTANCWPGKNSPAVEHCHRDEGLPSSEARKTKADEKMDKISSEGPRGLVELKPLKAALNRRLPQWP